MLFFLDKLDSVLCVFHIHHLFKNNQLLVKMFKTLKLNLQIW